MALIVFNNIPASVATKKNSFSCHIRFGLVSEVWVGAAGLGHAFISSLAYTFWLDLSIDMEPARNRVRAAAAGSPHQAAALRDTVKPPR